MSSYFQQEYDFISRTKKIIQQYNSLNIAEKDKYEVTLLLNCFVGLLILPQQHWYKNLPNEIISKDKWGISLQQIKYIKPNVRSVSNIVTHLRNSISHYRFEAFNDSSEKISSIKFIDCFPNNKRTFESVLDIDTIANFLDLFSDYILTKMKQT